MKTIFITFVAAVLLVLLGAYGCSYQLNYDEMAVHFRFQQEQTPATNPDGTLKRTEANELADPGSVEDKPGVHFRWIWPIDEVFVYSTKLQVLTDEFRQMQTADGNSVVVRSYMTWRIENPFAFQLSLKNIDNAEDRLTALLQTEISGQIGRYNFNQLVTTGPEEPALRTIEKDVLEAIQKELTQEGSTYGVVVEHVGLRRLVLPQQVTMKVFDRMKLSREAEAAKLRAAGEARGSAIRSEATSKAETIMRFAEERAEVIKSEGDVRAARAFAKFEGNEEFAIFLQQIEALKVILQNNTTFVLDAQSIVPFNLFAIDKQKTQGKE